MKKFCTVMAVLISTIAYAQPKTATSKALYQAFQQPGNAARPRVWWHWMNGNITQDGIRKDLLWMHRAGIGGFQHFEKGFLTPKLIDKPLTFMSPEWKDAFRLATRLADSLKLEMATAGSPGWSESGGPWVPAKDGMKKIVWHEMRVKGGQLVNAVIPKPYTTTGAYQNLPIQENIVAFSAKAVPPPEYYRDIAVIAFRQPKADVELAEDKPIVTTSGGHFTYDQLTDGDLATTTLLPRDSVSGFAWIQFAFPKPQTIRAISITGGGIREAFGSLASAENRWLEASDDGRTFRNVASMPLGGVAQQTITIPATTARFFRVAFKNPAASNQGGLISAPRPPAGTKIAELVLHASTRVNHVEEKAGFAATYDVDNYPTPGAEEVIQESNVLNLTSLFRANGTLNWTPPAGDWTIVRFGYSLTGKQNHPAPPEATGLEVDKMDAQAVSDYFTNYLNQYKDATGGLMGKRGLQAMITDSWEAEQATWTPRMAEEFQKRRGYNLLSWLPVLTGQVISSSEASDKFLWDWRMTIGELIAENHYDQLTKILARYGMKRYSESHENGRLYIVDGMDAKRTAAVPMSAIWVPTAYGSTYNMAIADIRESASVAHIYGQNLVAAESFTVLGLSNNAWSYHPANLKPTADMELAHGINRFVVQASVHQPIEDKLPGIGLGPVGTWFNRLDTWAEQSKAWTDYLARSSYMLQQGKFVADVVYYYGEDNNITGLFGAKLPDIPKGYDFDFINPHALLNLLTVRDGKLVTPSGMSYRVLALDSNARRMSLPVLRKLAGLVKGGAVICGAKPEMTASLTDNKAEFDQLVNDLWGGMKANVFANRSIQQVLTSLNIPPDFETTNGPAGADLRFVHRQTASESIYWVGTTHTENQVAVATFRIGGKRPQLWHPETGVSEPVSYTISNGRTRVSLPLSPNDAVFVVFQQPTTQPAVSLPVKTEQQIAVLEGPWTVAFQQNRGAPVKAQFDKLASYTENPDGGIKYFSGTAIYSKSVTFSASTLTSGHPIWLDLGDVGNLAEVIVNGQSLGIVWKKPFRVDVSRALKAGENRFQIQVTNLWVNRLIGDKQPETKNKITSTSMPYYKADSKLVSSGLLGPVRVITTQ